MSNRHRGARTWARAAGDALLTVGALVLLFAVYQLWWTNVQAAQAAESARSEIESSWQAEAAAVSTTPSTATPSPGATPGETPEVASTPATDVAAQPAIGKGFALMYIPRLADSVWGLPVVQGVDAAQLAMGVGHYPGTAMPGEVGNFATAAHRATNGEPFKDIDRLRKGDRVIVETKAGWYVYELEKDAIVLPTETWVIDPVPGDLGATPTEALITLTTCNPRWGSTERWIWWGALVETRTRAEGQPTDISATQEG